MIQGRKTTFKGEDATYLRPDRSLYGEEILYYRKITLIQKGNEIRYVIRDATTNQGLLQGVVKNGFTANEMKRECEVIVEPDGSPTFVKPARKWTIGDDTEVCLLKGHNELVWQVYRKSVNTRLQLEVSCPKVTFPDGGSHPFICRIGELDWKLSRLLVIDPNYTHIPRTVNDCFSILEDCTISKVEGVNAEVFKVYLKPRIIQKSRVSSEVLLSKFAWAVTLIREGEDSGLFALVLPKLANNHAKIIVEGIATRRFVFNRETEREIQIRPNEYFMVYIDFDGTALCGGKGVVKIGNITDKKLRYVERSQVWKASSSKILKALEDFGPIPDLNIFGSGSFLSKKGEESCITWAKKLLLKFGIRLPEDPIPMLVTLTSNYTASDEYYEQHLDADDRDY